MFHKKYELRSLNSTASADFQISGRFRRKIGPWGGDHDSEIRIPNTQATKELT